MSSLVSKTDTNHTSKMIDETRVENVYNFSNKCQVLFTFSLCHFMLNDAQKKTKKKLILHFIDFTLFLIYIIASYYLKNYVNI